MSGETEHDKKRKKKKTNERRKGAGQHNGLGPYNSIVLVAHPQSTSSLYVYVCVCFHIAVHRSGGCCGHGVSRRADLWQAHCYVHKAHRAHSCHRNRNVMAPKAFTWLRPFRGLRPRAHVYLLSYYCIHCTVLVVSRVHQCRPCKYNSFWSRSDFHFNPHHMYIAGIIIGFSPQIPEVLN